MVQLRYHLASYWFNIISTFLILSSCSSRSIDLDQSPGPKIHSLFTTQRGNAHRYLEELSIHKTLPSHQPISNFENHSQLSTSLLGRIGSNIKFNPHLDHLLNSFNQDTILENIKILSNGVGDQDDNNQWITRHSYSQGALKSVNWLKTQYEKLNYDGDTTNSSTVKCEFDYYLDGVAPNLICKMVWSFDDSIDHNNTYDDHEKIDNDVIEWQDARANQEEKNQDLLPDIHSIVLTAHYDSKGSFGSIEAPGVDDNASGCAVLLSIAKLIQENKKEILKLKLNHLDHPKLDPEEKSLRKNTSNKKFEIVFINFSGTEQGLIGSKSISKKMEQNLIGISKHDPKLILLLINVNMISYRCRYEPRQMGLSNLGCSSESLEFMKRISNTYVPELLVGNTSIGLSDEKNFQSIGIPNSIRIFESLGDSMKNPSYLQSSDGFSKFLNQVDLAQKGVDPIIESDGFYDIIQVVLIAKVLLASVIELLLS